MDAKWQFFAMSCGKRACDRDLANKTERLARKETL
jgi:hypothetical protein